jgi:hypothetical protein
MAARPAGSVVTVIWLSTPGRGGRFHAMDDPAPAVISSGIVHLPSHAKERRDAPAAMGVGGVMPSTGPAWNLDAAGRIEVICPGRTSRG